MGQNQPHPPVLPAGRGSLPGITRRPCVASAKKQFYFLRIKTAT
ncbi:hypothetical protein DVDV_0327 [Desulfovibrio sp. DV]|nr:hypothetical protein DVDV_0327 [Desulfovibrio sp. DV]